MDKIITISREYGSGGHDIGKRLAAELNIPFYDKEIITLAAKESGVDESDFEQLGEEPSAFQLSLAMLDPNNRNDSLFMMQSRTIRRLADRGPCVIVGRCADYVLRDCDRAVNVFVCSASLKRVRNIKKKGLFASRRGGGDAQEEQLRAVLEMDARRSMYYQHYTGQEWGKASNYHLCIDSSRIGMGACGVIRAYLDTCEGIPAGG